MPKLSEEARKKIADAVRKSWAARRAKQQGSAKPAAKPAATGRPRGKLSLEARKKIADALRRSWAARRAGRSTSKALTGGQLTRGASILSAVEETSRTLRMLTLDDIRPLSGQRQAAEKLGELATLASALKKLISA
ncbi:MAG: hypothetical protein HY207_10445 [Nitrospirae bacterium]|nr:hypothetical protein [Nitrospirota bacterium]